MRRITLWLLSTVTVVVLLFSYRTSTSTSFATSATAMVQQSTATSSGSTTSTGTSGSGTSGSGTTTKKKSSSTSQSTGTTTYTGSVFYNPYGPVQVQITVTGGKITAAKAVQYPDQDPRSQQINYYAVPALNGEVVQAQSANIDMVSGASFTSYDYLQSLQSAIDQANL